MTRLLRTLAAPVLAALIVLLSGGIALAHSDGSGASVTSNYRTRIRQITPSVDGLEVRIADVAGSVELSWRGAGTVVVLGYAGEPYLRISTAGVERNTRSPATYLNRDRYASTTPPVEADPDAEPAWTRISSGSSVRWHDHRNHWMSPVPPDNVASDRDHDHVIDRWEIPLDVNGRRVTIAGDLMWIAPPSSAAWWLGIGACIAVLLVLLFGPWWRRVAMGVVMLAALTLLIDTLGYSRAERSPAANTMWLLAWPLAALACAAWMIVVARRGGAPPLAMALTALVVGVVGGVDRLDTISHSQVFTSLPADAARAAAAFCVAAGAALLVRFLASLAPALLPAVNRSDRSVNV